MPVEFAGVNKANLQIIGRPGSRDGQRILEVKGRLTLATLFDFQDAMKSEDAPELIIDMSGVPYIDSAGLGELVATHVRAQKASRKLAFAGMNGRVHALIDMSHMSQVFHIYPTLKDAQAAAG
jgi:anti-sigma B factor antagonist